MTPSFFIFMSTTIMGTFITLSSTNWLYLWVGMELNLLSFIPLVASSQMLQETEASVKYFIIQAVGSGLMLTAGIMSTNPLTNFSFSSIIMTMFIISMAVKLGMAPCHQWLPHVMSSISWLMCMILATWQKISPMLLLIMLAPRETPFILFIVAMLSAIIGGVGGMNQSQLRALLAYSSIGHMSWILVTTQCSFNTFITYFSIYMLITVSLISLLMKSNSMQSKLSFSLSRMGTSMFSLIMIVMFSLGGLPPFLGFIPKWIIINTLADMDLYTIMMVLILGSLMNLFYYFNMTFNFILATPQSQKYFSMPAWCVIITMLCSITSLTVLIS
uniref:NADH-ubiquinone oxidoreductase chain 2 n=1 Tax=Hediste diversicolor TaxID=126592 RepID=A0A7T8JJH4_HEDDI|nr:NADH dehydrogenase subunit 2 [Hediste diversicolor]QQP21538.1 NADH dehydrogenase subunit 2 [Hediste diversicolor]